MTEAQGWLGLFLFSMAVGDYCVMRDYSRGAWRWVFVCAGILVLYADAVLR